MLPFAPTTPTTILAPIPYDPSSLPGSSAITTLLSGFSAWGVAAALVGMLLGAAMWAVGHHSSNYQQSSSGRKGVLVSAAAAAVMGAAPSLVSFFFHMGQTLK